MWTETQRQYNKIKKMNLKNIYKNIKKIIKNNNNGKNKMKNIKYKHNQLKAF